MLRQLLSCACGSRTAWNQLPLHASSGILDPREHRRFKCECLTVNVLVSEAFNLPHAGVGGVHEAPLEAIF